MTSRYNKQALEVKALLRGSGVRDRFKRELQRFRDWQARWEQENDSRLKQYSAMTARMQFPNSTEPQKERDRLARERQEIERKLERINVEPSPWDRLLRLLEHTQPEHFDRMAEFFTGPATPIPSLNAADTLCLQYVRLAILHDVALCEEGTYQSLTAGILDWQEVQNAWERMTDPHASWDFETTINEALKDVAAEHAGDNIKDQRPDCSHTADFSSVMWYGEPYDFNETQAKCVAALWAEWEKNPDGKAGLHRKTIQDIIKSDNADLRLLHLFRRKGKPHPAWGRMIHSYRNGTFYLGKPTAAHKQQSKKIGPKSRKRHRIPR